MERKLGGMIFIFLTALAIFGLDVFMSSWKAMAIGACALATLYLLTILRPQPLRITERDSR
jgi:hypothetical protein